MKRLTGREMKRLVFAVTVMILALVIAVIAYFMTDVIVTTDRNIEKNKQMVLDKTVMTIRDMGTHTGSISTNAKFLGMLNQDMLDRVLQGEALPLYELVVQLAAMSNPLEYVGVIVDGEVATYLTPTGEDIDLGEIPGVPAEGDLWSWTAWAERKATSYPCSTS